jgi:cell wall-associated NlpC family hydrolase
VQNGADGYVGYVAESALHDPAPAGDPSHTLKVLRSFVYPEPNLKTPPIETLSFMSPLRVVGARAGYSEIALAAAGGGWVYTAHLTQMDETERDFVASAHLFLGVPYLWGGRSSLGLDCSALVQLVLARAGLPCPRDSGVQAREIGEPVAWRAGETRLQRGDLVFFPGHCAIALDDTRVLHSNAGAMLTAVEPLADVVRRVEAESGGRGITAVRRVEL